MYIYIYLSIYFPRTSPVALSNGFSPGGFSTGSPTFTCVFIYIYIYREREREIDIYIYVYLYVYMHMYVYI